MSGELRKIQWGLRRSPPLGVFGFVYPAIGTTGLGSVPKVPISQAKKWSEFSVARRASDLTLKATARLVKDMKLTKIQMEQIARAVIDELKSSKQLVFKAPEEKVYTRAFELVREDFERESKLDREVNAMLDELEKKSPGEFQRFKMFPLLKKKLAQQKGIVL